MYLSRLILNLRSRQVRRELANPYEMHRTIMNAFPETLPDGERVLFRLENQPQGGAPVLLVQSQSEPDWSHLVQPEKTYLDNLGSPFDPLENPAVKSIAFQFVAGQPLLFRLRANPTVKRQGKRRGLVQEADQRQWLTRKLTTAGCTAAQFRIQNQQFTQGKLQKPGADHTLQFVDVLFEGQLVVDDPGKLVEAVMNGIGPAKGLGFGLLSLAPVR